MEKSALEKSMDILRRLNSHRDGFPGCHTCRRQADTNTGRRCKVGQALFREFTEAVKKETRR
jgi:hypothetical protein